VTIIEDKFIFMGIPAYSFSECNFNFDFANFIMV